MTGSEKILKRRNIWAFDKPLTKTEQQMENFYSSYSNPEGGEDTLRMDQFDAQFPMETRGSSKKRRRNEDRSWQKINTFLVVISKIKPELHGFDMQRC